MAASITELESRFRIPGIAQVLPGQGSWPKVQVTAPAASGEIYLHGAHVTSWKPAGFDEVLFMSPNTMWQEGKAIRGGIPICYPWFGDKAGDPRAPAHGFVRARTWQLDAVEQHGDAVSVTMSTESDDGTRQWWPADFRTTYRVTFGAELVLELTTGNTGNAPLRLEEALHTYYKVGDATQARITGLEGHWYIDKTDSFREKLQRVADLVLTSTTDRVYLNTQHTLELTDPVLQRKISVAKQNSRTTVVWNPWPEKARELKDLGETQWKTMLCLEASNVGDFGVELKPGEQHTMMARTTVAKL